MVFDLIKKRRSVFPAQYNDRRIAKDIIEKILEAANWAPNHNNTEPWRFKVVQGEASKVALGEFLAKTYKEKTAKPKNFKHKKLKTLAPQSAAAIAICMQRDPKESIPEWEEIAAVAMAVQNMWLCCTEMGIGSYWSSPGLIKFMDGFFDLNDGERCLGFFYMGYFDGALPQVEKGSIQDKVIWMD